MIGISLKSANLSETNYGSQGHFSDPHHHHRYLWEASSNPYHISWDIVKKTESSGIPKIFRVENFLILCDDISGS
jgi:hypothetical protein